jgi:hypothetical protein
VLVAKRRWVMTLPHAASADATATVAQRVDADRKAGMVIVAPSASAAQRRGAGRVHQMLNDVLRVADQTDVVLEGRMAVPVPVVRRTAARKHAVWKICEGLAVRRSVSRSQIWMHSSFGLITIATTC